MLWISENLSTIVICQQPSFPPKTIKSKIQTFSFSPIIHFTVTIPFHRTAPVSWGERWAAAQPRTEPKRSEPTRSVSGAATGFIVNIGFTRIKWCSDDCYYRMFRLAPKLRQREDCRRWGAIRNSDCPRKVLLGFLQSITLFRFYYTPIKKPKFP